MRFTTALALFGSFLVLGHPVACLLRGNDAQEDIIYKEGEDSLEERNLPRPKKDACVSLFQYKNQDDCTGEYTTLTFPTASEPGSRCEPGLWWSVKDQYCNFETGNWQQKAYLAYTCDRSWLYKHTKLHPDKQKYTPDTCTYGLKLHYCKMGPCQEYVDDGGKEGSNHTTEITSSTSTDASNSMYHEGAVMGAWEGKAA